MPAYPDPPSPSTDDQGPPDPYPIAHALAHTEAVAQAVVAELDRVQDASRSPLQVRNSLPRGTTSSASPVLQTTGNNDNEDLNMISPAMQEHDQLQSLPHHPSSLHTVNAVNAAGLPAAITPTSAAETQALAESLMVSEGLAHELGSSHTLDAYPNASVSLSQQHQIQSRPAQGSSAAQPPEAETAAATNGRRRSKITRACDQCRRRKVRSFVT
jgi:hypothetical protein